LIKFSTGFKTVGAAYSESIALLEALYLKQSWEKLKIETFNSNLLKKRSNRWIGHHLQYFQMRYIYDHPPLPNWEYLSRYTYLVKSRQSQVQVLYQYICETHPFVDRLMNGLVGENLRKYNVFRLTRSIFDDFLKEQALTHPEIEEWSGVTIDKFRSDFFILLRASGIMEKHPSLNVRKFIITSESFAFILYGLLDESFTPSEILNSHIWRRYFISRVEIEQILAECQVRGWLQFRSYGDISELVPRFASLGEWMDAIE